MEKAIRERAARGEYDRITDGADLARSLTEHLQAFSRDKHLRVNFSPEPLEAGFGAGGPIVVRRAPGGGRPLRGLAGDGGAGIEEVGRLGGNVGLLEMSLFERLPLVADKVTEAINRLADTDALIIDLRGNRGGESGTVRLLMSYFFDRPVHVNSYRGSNGFAINFIHLPEQQAGGAMLQTPSWFAIISSTEAPGP